MYTLGLCSATSPLCVQYFWVQIAVSAEHLRRPAQRLVMSKGCYRFHNVFYVFILNMVCEFSPHAFKCCCISISGEHGIHVDNIAPL